MSPGGQIRTAGLSVPNRARCQAALHPDVIFDVVLVVVLLFLVVGLMWTWTNKKGDSSESPSAGGPLSTVLLVVDTSAEGLCRIERLSHGQAGRPGVRRDEEIAAGLDVGTDRHLSGL